MNILVCSRISIPAKDRTLPTWEHLRALGHEIIVEHPSSVPTTERPDAMISMGVTIMEETFEALDRFPGVPLYCYNWDCYEWVWKNPRPGEYDYVRYGELLRKAEEVWVPSVCTARRTVQWWNIPPNRIVRILSACPWWDHPNVRDEGYALCCLREIPDPWWGMFEKCCEEMNIPYRMSKHEKSYEEYQDLVAGCKFLCAPLYELSTGGLSLMEGYRLGKPVLLSDSEWNGGVDYFGKRAAYFRHGDVADFQRWLYVMYHGVWTPNLECQKRYIEENFSDERMGENMLGRILATAGKGERCV